MPTNLAIDDNLLEMAKNIGKHKTKRAAVTEALEEYIQRRKQIKITTMFGKIDYDKEYDYKKQRSVE
jgi:Arc/MetJ family transcription regulator